jgi:hypothetical protein
LARTLLDAKQFDAVFVGSGAPKGSFLHVGAAEIS